MTTALYRVYAGRKLLYVGISDGVLRRIHQHATTKPWWGQVSRVQIAHYATREEAALAEAAAIFQEKPEFNVLHSDRLREDFLLMDQRDAVDRIVHEVLEPAA